MNDIFEGGVREKPKSLRDEFAMQALVPFVTWALDQPHFVDYDSAAKACAGYAKSAYLIADAMLAERAK